MNKNYIVTKSNTLITCNYDLNLQEQKIILTLASMVQPQDTEFKQYEFIIKDFIALLGLKDQSKYTEVRKITKALKEKVFEIKEGTDIIQVSWLGGVRYKPKQGIVMLRLDPDLKPYMLQLKELYTSYKLENILTLKSKYSLRIYELLKSNQFKKEWEIDLEDLRKILVATESSYLVYQNVKNRIILQAQKELKEKTDISFDFHEIKTGRKVTAIKFKIRTNKKPSDEEFTTKGSKYTNAKESCTTEPMNDVQAIFNENITGLEAKSLLSAANGDINIIKEKYEIAKVTSGITTIVGWVIDAIKRNYQLPKVKENTGGFNYDGQRPFDPTLEEKLLGWKS
ncbi:replication initiation protein [Clostridium estertheticum]|uniref:replication initiation protein n=1 Tax=Clostridium estertheticum TaxID=238834 RepID=UPI001C0B76DB|nr:replication initiation protein [Clostridium estertheticum]MBU3173400.1 replication initiation protein [Clostridium estertheticum]